ncbi:MAG: helix-turn-helix domain-containing protein [Candidatus Hydrothermarchaeales archaeon]
MSSKHFRACRQGLGLSQADVAFLFGVSKYLIYSYERGTYPVSAMASRLMHLLVNNPELQDQLISFKGEEKHALPT